MGLSITSCASELRIWSLIGQCNVPIQSLVRSSDTIKDILNLIVFEFIQDDYVEDMIDNMIYSKQHDNESALEFLRRLKIYKYLLGDCFP